MLLDASVCAEPEFAGWHLWLYRPTLTRVYWNDEPVFTAVRADNEEGWIEVWDAGYNSLVRLHGRVRFEPVVMGGFDE